MTLEDMANVAVVVLKSVIGVAGLQDHSALLAHESTDYFEVCLGQDGETFSVGFEDGIVKLKRVNLLADPSGVEMFPRWQICLERQNELDALHTVSCKLLKLQEFLVGSFSILEV